MSDVRTDEPVTVAVTRVIRPGKEREFAEWADEVDTVAASFDGHLGGIRLHDVQGVNHLVYWFDSESNLRAWEESPRRHALIERGDRISERRSSTASGLESWFDVGADSPKWKNFVLTWAAAYPTLLVVNLVLNAALPELPKAVLLLITSGILVTLLTWVILPRLNRRARPWLLRGASPDPADRPSS
jgi:antibiotic biosynthesis monooxygenase (ABM) superfamily enzyme